MAITKSTTVDEVIYEKEGPWRFRTLAFILGSVAAFLLTFISDPDMPTLFSIPMGASVFLLIKTLVYFALAALMIHVGCKTMFDYLDRSGLLKKAVEDGQAGNAFIGLGLFMVAFALVFFALVLKFG